MKLRRRFRPLPVLLAALPVVAFAQETALSPMVISAP